ncbi:MAG: hypothetical protein QOH55_1755 [Microbacteriaceae bacterium]|jgi:endogenous inhibitor of DNA gyrase (YacG/DUF329 family)|nr:hypothetical protein [Microbacteriaceae bacterium]
MTTDTERIRLAIYQRFAETGQSSSREYAAAETALDDATVDVAFETLADQRHIVLGEDGEIVLAHPFASINLGFSVMGEHTLWWGGCAWDSFAIPHLVADEPSVLIATTCPGCGKPLAWTVTRDHPPEGSEVAHFLTPIARVWDDVLDTCAHQRIFCGEQCVEVWLTETGHERGSVFDLATLWRLAAHWYEGRLNTPYRRREPAQSSAYFRKAGLRGAFWGLEE